MFHLGLDSCNPIKQSSSMRLIEYICGKDDLAHLRTKIQYAFFVFRFKFKCWNECLVRCKLRDR
ncbi:hypothetical protein A8B76_19210 [Roseovarius indicus]|nr:hypothetical protein A8B76_19210 [Roseovarius indicus]